MDPLPGRMSRHHTIVCSQCGRAAAELALLPAVPEGDGLWHDRDRLERTDFMGTVIKFGAWETLSALFDSLSRADFDSSRGDDADFVSFYCLACRRVYCDTCWQAGSPVFDEGFYDYTLGTCPQGHEQTIDD